MYDGSNGVTRPERANSTAGARLRPGTVEALKEDLERQRTFQAHFLERYFPRITERGSVEYEDIDHITPDQAEAMAYSLAKSVRSFVRDAARHRGGGPVSLLKDPNGEAVSEPYEIKAKQYTTALRDLCQAFGLDSMI